MWHQTAGKGCKSGNLVAVVVVVAEGFWERQRNNTRIVGKGDLCYTVGESSTKVSPVVWEVENVPNEL